MILYNDAAKARRRRNLETNTWHSREDDGLPPLPGQIEEAYAPHLHPRDRLGRWIDTPDTPDSRPPASGDGNGWHRRFPLQPDPNLVFRGVSKEEMQEIARTGAIKSRGLGNFGDAQVGTTFYSIDPRQAQVYAGGLFDRSHAPTFDKPHYVMAVRRPPEDQVDRAAAGSVAEVPVRGSLPASDIIDLYEVRPYAINEDGTPRDSYRHVALLSHPLAGTHAWDLSVDEFANLDWPTAGGASATPREVFNSPPGTVVTARDYAGSPIFSDIRGDEEDAGDDPAWAATLDRDKVANDVPLTMYRAVEAGRPDDVIIPGDYVTENEAYAKLHGEEVLGGHYRLVSMSIKPSELATVGDPHEFQWWPTDPASALARVSEEAKALGLAEASFAPSLHPRGRQGRFVETPDPLDRPTVRRARVGGDYEAVGPGGDLAVRPTRAGAERALRQIEADPGSFKDAPNEPFARDPDLVRTAREMVLSGEPTTRDRYARVVGGRVIYKAERRDLHRKIVEGMLAGHASREHPAAFFTGGGYASGKGGIVDAMNSGKGHPWKPAGAVDIDPDKIKAQIPEFQQLTADGDPEANLRVYEEAWDISQELAAEVLKRKVDVIVDGVGNTSPQEALGRVNAYRRAGFSVKGVYAAAPADVAIDSAHRRMEQAEKAGKLESIRFIPDDVMLATHQRVSKAFPEILAGWPGDLEVYDTNTWDPDAKQYRDPRLILSKRDGKIDVLDPKTYEAFLSKATNPHATWAAVLTSKIEGGDAI